MTGREIVRGVVAGPEVVGATLDCGTVEGLAQGVRDALWSMPEIFRNGDAVTVLVGGDGMDCEEPSIEVALPDGTHLTARNLPEHVLRRLEEVREENMPNENYAYFPCDCPEYCDQSHGEGRLKLTVHRPSFHELAVFLGK